MMLTLMITWSMMVDDDIIDCDNDNKDINDDNNYADDDENEMTVTIMHHFSA